MTTVSIERANRFKHDFKREFKTHGAGLDMMLFEALAFLTSGTPLPTKYQDHKLTGEWEGYRECHLKPDLLLVYGWPDDETLRLARLGSHSELFGL